MVSQSNQIKRIAKGQESNDDKILKIAAKVEMLKSDMSQNFFNAKEDLKERINDLDSIYKESLEDMASNSEAVKVMARDQVTNKERELSEMITK